MKKIFSRVLPLCLAACLLTALLPGAALAAQADSNGILWMPDGCQPYQYNSILFSEGRMAVTQTQSDKTEKVGYVDEDLNLVIPCVYDEAKEFSDGLAYVRQGDNKYFIDPNGNKMFDYPARVLSGKEFTNGYLVGSKREEVYSDYPDPVCVMDTTGTMRFVLDNKKYCNASSTVYNERLLVREVNADYYGFVDMSGNEVIPLKYDYASNFYDGYACVREGTALRIIDTAGNVVGTLPTPVKDPEPGYSYVSCDQYGDGAFIVDTGIESDDGYSSTILISKEGKQLLPGTYSYIEPGFGPGIFEVSDNDPNHYGSFFAKLDGTFINTTPYLSLGRFSEGLAAVRTFDGNIVNYILDNKWGFIDMTGKEVVPFIYDEVGSFSEGLASVKKGGKCGYIDKTGQVVIPLQYDGYTSCMEFHGGLAPVETDGKWGLVDTSGNWVVQPTDGLMLPKWMDGRSTPCWMISDGDRVGLLAQPTGATKNQSQISFTKWLFSPKTMDAVSLDYKITNSTTKKDTGICAFVIVSSLVSVHPFDYTLAPGESVTRTLSTPEHAMGGLPDGIDYDERPEYWEDTYTDHSSDADEAMRNSRPYGFILRFDSEAERTAFLESLPWVTNESLGYEALVAYGTFLDPYEAREWLAENFDGAMPTMSVPDYRNPGTI